MALWTASFPDKHLRDLISEQWKEMGWQGKDPSTDFRYVFLSFYFLRLHILPLLHFRLTNGFYDRGGGYISLENLLYFARNFPVFQLLLNSLSLFLYLYMFLFSSSVSFSCPYRAKTWINLVTLYNKNGNIRSLNTICDKISSIDYVIT